MELEQWIKENWWMVAIGVFALIVVIVIFWHTGASGSPSSQGLAQKLKDANVKLYTASWCGYSTKQKKDFGSDFGTLSHSACGDTKGSCPEYVKSFPTWVQHEGTAKQKVVPGYLTAEHLKKEFL